MARKPEPASQWIKLTEHGIEVKPPQALDFDIASVEFDRLKDLNPVPEIDISLPGLPECNSPASPRPSRTAAANSTAA